MTAPGHDLASPRQCFPMATRIAFSIIAMASFQLSGATAYCMWWGSLGAGGAVSLIWGGGVTCSRSATFVRLSVVACGGATALDSCVRPQNEASSVR